ncbi:retron St85 family effector protein [Colwellia sp. E2M01]|uniref:retron St85 family effector protein n=1 Tax=Colwellia sp. E2M01 TaxID=2841561 RepID=UPI001C086104|nr:retron St85 family effector protein [Colwellia sp. E2M01]MBU2869429.1 retron St85 family effector protein [Colwellia sp. E2M01]
MERNLRDKDLEQVSKIVKDKIFVPKNEKQVTVFLCGADIKNNKTARSKMASLFSSVARYELLYPEDIFDDLLAGAGKHSLLTLENVLAGSVDAIVIFPESPGSFAELGAFSNNEKLAEKMIVLANKKYERDKSFINYGPNRLVKASDTGKVFHLNYGDFSDEDNKKDLYKKVNDQITKIRKAHPVPKNVANLLETENFILPCIYLIDEIDHGKLYKLLEFATDHNKQLCEIATKSSLGRLVSKNYITRTPKGFKVTELGADYVRKTFKDQSLDKARIEILNTENRRNSSVSYGRVQ